MKIKFPTSLACSSFILLMVSGTGYATVSHDGHLHASTDVVADSRPVGRIKEKPKSGMEIFEKNSSENQDVVSPEEAVSGVEIRDTVALKDSANGLLNDVAKANFVPKAIFLETVSPRTVPTATVSEWLEARANEDTNHEGHSHEEPEFFQDKQVDAFGGGWCNACGCWMRHGCDPNGNCSIGHTNVCGGNPCNLHPTSSCTSN